ncbi:MAG: acyl-CoA dehydrogenase family protein [Actinomycetota bacterium]|jgi:alkylation response protein AidB-like acyl-CoA dehydrogenase|nr:acyl-CoA dehydrogenase family protein [Actinomycetota bacterium]
MSDVTDLVTDDLLATIAPLGDRAEAERRLTDDAVELLRSSGLLRTLVPSRVGGDEADLGSMVSAVQRIGVVDSAASWVLMVLVAHDWMMGSFPEQAQDAVYADGADTVIPGSLAPAGTAVAADDGWIVSGRWPFASGADHGHWYLLGTVEPVEDGRPRLIHIVVPRAEVSIEDTWYPIGLRGTGSADVVLDSVYIPQAHTIDSGELLGGRSAWSSRHPTNLYRTPILPGLAVHVAASSLGIARGGLIDAAGRFGVQNDAYLGSAKAERPGLQMRLAESTAELRSAELLLDDTVNLLARAADGNDTRELRAHAKYQASYSIELARRSLDRVVTAAGGRAVFDGSRLQRCYRDITMASQHQVADLDTVGEAYGRTLLGLNPGAHPL